ncbi:gp436 family protein [Oceanibaculum indicum]|uniref:DUF1320 domain-containing protein n=1 Tax=Oceanibaculum indicum P24 TaxID=1207063 RepID=K2JSH9_9PROT|nr:DUF1320 domain-containing protein [Oceanibaculum indicum]EKE78433.1 hypothetical protein P24_02696 [Oceanibaculum indicum P24]
MAAYITQQQLIERYTEERLVDLTNQRQDGDQIDQEALDRAIADAEAAVNGYVGVRHALPLPVVPELLTQIAAAIVFYQLHVETAPDKVAADYKAAIAKLTDIATGKITLPGLPGQSAPAGAGKVLVSTGGRQVTDSMLADYEDGGLGRGGTGRGDRW